MTKLQNLLLKLLHRLLKLPHRLPKLLHLLPKLPHLLLKPPRLLPQRTLQPNRQNNFETQLGSQGTNRLGWPMAAGSVLAPLGSHNSGASLQ